MSQRGFARRLVAAMAGLLWFGMRLGRADLVVVPLERQAELVARVAAYDRNIVARAGDRVRVLLITNDADPEPIGIARRMEAALQSISDIAGLAHEERVTPCRAAAGRAGECRSQHIAIVYLGAGLTSQVPAIRSALDGVDVLTIAAVPEYVELGAILGFDVLSGKPKLLVNLTQARKQHVDLRADLLKLARVI